MEVVVRVVGLLGWERMKGSSSFCLFNKKIPFWQHENLFLVIDSYMRILSYN